MTPPQPSLSPRQRVQLALNHQTPDRIPVDFLATTEVWKKLQKHFAIPEGAPRDDEYYDPSREQVLRKLDVDCRVISYDSFLNLPANQFKPGGVVDWWTSADRSTPNRMWRQALPDGSFQDIWGRHSGMVKNDFGTYEEHISNPLAGMTTLEEIKAFSWPAPDWWDFSGLPALLADLDREQEYHIRFRVGSVFEVAWQLRGMEAFLLDLVTQPALAEYIMDCLTDVYIANLETVLELSGDRIDAVYFYDDVATQNSLMVSKKVWQRSIQPRHARLIEVAQRYGKHVMYHCDGAIAPLIPALIEMGVDILNPIQADAKGMEPEGLKAAFGDRLSFHGGIDIIKTLRTATPAGVAAEVRDRIRVLGESGGYILASSHHIQPDTPLENILAMYALGLRSNR